ncbi:hypothetical protein KPH14_012199 [Odynerus spinipes]|uniref:Uncharacterized protein n=1 Tax=Odynerus spinipes TaxID=1348599 RepID=A0AAD9RFR5_9HYME|nr:hypothetical protein KPH14_012199 [Odynerus spinipes]
MMSAVTIGSVDASLQNQGIQCHIVCCISPEQRDFASASNAEVKGTNRMGQTQAVYCFLSSNERCAIWKEPDAQCIPIKSLAPQMSIHPVRNISFMPERLFAP